MPSSLPKPNLWLGWSLALASTIAFSTGPTIVKFTQNLGLNTNLILAARFVLSTLMLGALGQLTPSRLRLAPGIAATAFGIGLVNGVSMLTFFWSLTVIHTSVAAMLFSLYPLAVLGLLALRGERFTRRQFIRLALGLGGVYLLVGPGGNVAVVGIGLVLVSVLFSAVATVLMQWTLQGYEAQAVTFYTVAGITVMVLTFWAVQGIQWQDPGALGWLAFLLLAVVNTILSRLMWFIANRNLGSGQVALLVPLETFLTTIWSVLFLQEQLTLTQWLGGALILSSALFAIPALSQARWRQKPSR